MRIFAPITALILLVFIAGPGCNYLTSIKPLQPLAASGQANPELAFTAAAAEPAADTTLGMEPQLAEPQTTPPAATAEQSVEIPEATPALPQTTLETDLWERMRTGMRMRDYDHDRVQQELKWFAAHQEYLDRVADRADPFLHLIIEEVEKRNMPSEIALLPVVESAFQPFAYSHGRAAGIWQFIPGTGRLYGLKQNWWYDGRRDILASTNAALDYLQALNKAFDGDWQLALAAYNSGEGTVRKAIRYNQSRNRPTDFWNLRLPRETRAYVPKLLAISALVASPEQHGITLKAIDNTHKLAVVETGAQIDLALAAELAGLSVDEMYQLNPGFNRWATDPDGPHHLLIPVDNQEDFVQQLAALPTDERVQWMRHRITSGESLISIAKKYATTVALLRKVNNLHGNQIRAGKHLIIPVATRSLASYSLSKEQRSKSRLSQSGKGNKVIHTVRPGDTFWDISRKYNVSMKRLTHWNGMAPRDSIKPGQKLVVWTGGSTQQASTTKVSVPQFTPTDRVSKIRYTVRSGDSLARISKKFNVTIKQLQKWNSKARGKYLQPGQTLTVYVDITRQT